MLFFEITCACLFFYIRLVLANCCKFFLHQCMTLEVDFLGCSQDLYSFEFSYGYLSFAKKLQYVSL